MGMGYGANYADVIEQAEVKEICPAEYDEFVGLLDEEYTFDTFASEYDVTDDVPEAIEKAFYLLQVAFEQNTGLGLSIGFHSSDDSGDRYDDVNGGYFSVDGMYELSEAGKRIGDKVQRKHWVTFG